MIRRAFIMRLKPDTIAEYRRHHEKIWPELVAQIEGSGIASVTTFWCESQVVIVSEVTDPQAWERLWTSQVHDRWKQLLAPFVQLADDGAPAASELVEMSHVALDGAASATGTSESSDDSDERAAILSIADAPALVRRGHAAGSRAKAPVAQPSERRHKMGAPRAAKAAIKKAVGKKKAKRKKVKRRKRIADGKKTGKARTKKTATKAKRTKSRKSRTTPRPKTSTKKSAPKRR